MEAAIKGAGEIGFTIVSISLSLVAVFIPLLLMGGIIGRLFREFAVTRVDDDLRLDAGVADPDADDVLALHAQQAAGPARPTLCAVASAVSTRCSPATEEPRSRAPPPPDDLLPCSSRQWR